jgi:hypothetical protein
VNHGHRRKKRGASQGIGNIFNKIIAENFPYFKKEMPIQVQKIFYISRKRCLKVQKASRTPNRHDQNRFSQQYIRVKTESISTEDKERIQKAVRQKN